MSGEVREPPSFKNFATEYDPIKIGSIDGTDTEPHDRAIVRALNSEYTPDKRIRGDARRTVFVGRLNPRTIEDTVASEMSKHGKVVQCRLVRDVVTGKSKQYAFVEFESSAAAERALQHMHGEMLEGARVIVEREAGRLMPGWRPRRRGGGLGGRKEGGQLRFGGRDRPWRAPIVSAPINRQIQ